MCQAREIRRVWEGRITLKMLAQQYDVGIGVVQQILHGQSYRENEKAASIEAAFPTTSFDQKGY